MSLHVCGGQRTNFGQLFQAWELNSGNQIGREYLCPLSHLSDSNLLMSAPIGMNFPQRAAFTVSCRFCYVVSLFSFNSGISSFSGVLFDLHEFVGFFFLVSLAVDFVVSGMQDVISTFLCFCDLFCVPMHGLF